MKIRSYFFLGVLGTLGTVILTEGLIHIIPLFWGWNIPPVQVAVSFGAIAAGGCLIITTFSLR
jgi:hypothetical protein